MVKITQRWIFPELNEKRIECQFDEPHSSTDGGAVLLKAADRKLGLSGALARCLVERRQAGKIQHPLEDLLRQRVYALAAGYPDGNDHAKLAGDPLFKLLLDRSPVKGADLSSQPTLSRFENSLGAVANYRLAQALAVRVIERQRLRKRKVHRVTIDLDTTDDPTHGQQQFACFNAHYDTRCYLTLLAFLSFDREPEQYLVAGLLRPGNASEKDRTVVGLLARLVALVRRAFPGTIIRVRLDGGFVNPVLLDYLDGEPGVEYVLGLPKNSVLTPEAEPLLERARALADESGQSERAFGEALYQAQSWDRPRRVIVKGEVTYHPGRDPKDNPRFLVTNLKQTPAFVYRKIYCGRGEIENRIKELHYGLELDRNSCSRFWANQFRVTLTVAAYALLQELRTQARGTSLARAQVATLQNHLLKLSARVTESVRRIVLHLPETFLFRAEWTRIARRLGAAPG